MTNSYLRRKAFRNFFTASALTMLVFQINGFVDSIIVGRFVTPDAISAIGLMGPVAMLILLLSDIVSTGASLIAARWIGAQDYRNASRMNVVCLASMLLIYGLACILTVTFSKDIANLLTDDPRLLVLLYDYMPVFFVYVCLFPLFTILYRFIEIAGRPDLVTKSITIMCVTNILLDLLFVVAFGWGIKGAAWATLVSSALSNVVYVRFYISKDCIYHREKLQKDWGWQMFTSAFKTGVPTGAGSLASAILTAALNAIALKATGADGLFVLTVGLQVLMLCSVVIEGTAGSISSFGSILLGEKDMSGYHKMVVNSRKSSIIAVGILTLSVIAVPEAIAKAFGASEQLAEFSVTPLREFFLLFIPYCTFRLFTIAFQVQGHKTLTSLLMVGKLICILFAVVFALKVCPQYIWLSGLAGLSLLLFCMMFVTWQISKHRTDLHWLTLIEIYPESPSINESVSYNRKSVDEILSKAGHFLDICELAPETAGRIRHCIEELSLNIVDMSATSKRKRFFDVRVVDEKYDILVVIKDDNQPFNPSTGLATINAMCPDIKYQYLNGINCTYLKFEKQK